MRFILLLLLVGLSTPAFAQHRHRTVKKSHRTVKKSHRHKVTKRARKNRHKVFVKSRGFRYGYEHRHYYYRPYYRPYYRSHYYHHVHGAHCPPSHRTEVRVVTVEKSFSPPSLSCPARTEESRNGLTQWCETDRGTRHGPYREWRTDGSLSVTGQYEYDTKEDVWLFYHKNGVISREITYEDGASVGVSYAWDQEGNPVNVRSFDE